MSIMNEKLKAQYLTYLLREFGKSREDILKNFRSTGITKKKDKKERSNSKPLEDRKPSPEGYMINIVETEGNKADEGYKTVKSAIGRQFIS